MNLLLAVRFHASATQRRPPRVLQIEDTSMEEDEEEFPDA
jgi:hypothetical protein